MHYIDLHVHSNASDGTLSPSEVIALAASCDLSAIALTDHDTIDGMKEAQAAVQNFPNLELIPGIEISCMYQETEIHILGLYVHLEIPLFIKEVKELLDIRNQRNHIMLQKFQSAGFQFDEQDLTNGNPDTVITRAHFARVLLEKGYVSSMNQAFDRYLYYGSTFCQHKKEVTPERALEILNHGKAFPVLAHPCQYKLGYANLETLTGQLIEHGLKGIEVYHSSNNQHESGRLKEIAKKYNLLPTGGSDFHGSNKPDIQIGKGRGGLRVSSLLLDDIKNKIKADNIRG